MKSPDGRLVSDDDYRLHRRSSIYSLDSSVSTGKKHGNRNFFHYYLNIRYLLYCIFHSFLDDWRRPVVSFRVCLRVPTKSLQQQLTSPPPPPSSSSAAAVQGKQHGYIMCRHDWSTVLCCVVAVVVWHFFQVSNDDRRRWRRVLLPTAFILTCSFALLYSSVRSSIAGNRDSRSCLYSVQSLDTVS